MASNLHTGLSADRIHRPVSDDFSCVVIKTVWNTHITSALAEGALSCFRKAGIADERVKVLEVPGAVELVYAASRAIAAYRPSAVIILGCVIRGDTPHFDYVCDTVTQGVTLLNAKGDIPVIFGLLTVNNEQQALDRAGGIVGNKGYEAAQTAIEMANFAYTHPAD